MDFLQRASAFSKRLMCGDDVVLVKQTQDHWNRQFQNGRWNHLMTGWPNTALLGGIVLRRASTSDKTIKVLDVGCGNGALAEIITRSDKVEYLGFDVSDAAIKLAKAAAPQGIFYVGDAEQALKEKDKFDVFIFNEVFYYINPDKILREYCTHATKETLVVISMIRSWRSHFLWPRIRKYVQLTRSFTVHENGGQNHTWDIWVGNFRQDNEL